MIASASKGATDRTVTSSGSNFSGAIGTESVTMTCSTFALLRRSTASPVRTGWVAAISTRRAPCLCSACASFEMVPPVVMMSSTTTQSAFHVTGNRDHLHLVIAGAPLVAEGDGRLELVGDRLGSASSTRIGGDDREVLQVQSEEVFGDDPMRREVVGRHVEEAFDGLGVEVEQQQPVGAGERDEVGDQLGGYRFAGLGLALLARVAVVGDDGRHPSG